MFTFKWLKLKLILVLERERMPGRRGSWGGDQSGRRREGRVDTFQKRKNVDATPNTLSPEVKAGAERDEKVT